MPMVADKSHVLMSDVLKGRVAELDARDDVSELMDDHVMVVAERVIKGAIDTMTGILRGVMFGIEPELEMRVDIKQAMEVVKAEDLSFKGFRLEHGDSVVEVPGPFVVKACRFDEISAEDQLCTLGLHLKKPAR